MSAYLPPWKVPQSLATITTPLKIENWHQHLLQMPDREFASYILRGIAEGFHIGFDGRLAPTLISAKSNMCSAREHPLVVTEYLEEECWLGWVLGPLDEKTVQGVQQISRFGVIPKGRTPGKWRLIVDLSAPSGYSVNDAIPESICSLQYTSVDEAAAVIATLGRDCLLAKIDIKTPYRIVPVHPEHQPLLGMSWEGETYVDLALPFGLRSALKIFNVLADCLTWVMRKEGVDPVLHHLDDFILFGPPGEPDRKGCTKRELLSLIGLLQHTCRVVQSGRSFLRCMINLSTVATEPHHHVRLNRGFRSDLQWWAVFLPIWNGAGILDHSVQSGSGMTVTSHASGGWGCGAYSEKGHWFQLPWPGAWKEVHITCKELLPIVVASAVWGNELAGQTMKCKTDNAAVVGIVKSGSSKDELAMHIVRCLSFFMARFQIRIVASHIPGSENGAADALSRNCLPLFRSQVPAAKPEATGVPRKFWDMLVLRRPDWTFPDWSRQFSATLQRV